MNLRSSGLHEAGHQNIGSVHSSKIKDWLRGQKQRVSVFRALKNEEAAVSHHPGIAAQSPRHEAARLIPKACHSLLLWSFVAHQVCPRDTKTAGLSKQQPSGVAGVNNRRAGLLHTLDPLPLPRSFWLPVHLVGPLARSLLTAWQKLATLAILAQLRLRGGHGPCHFRHLVPSPVTPNLMQDAAVSVCNTIPYCAFAARLGHLETPQRLRRTVLLTVRLPDRLVESTVEIRVSNLVIFILALLRLSVCCSNDPFLIPKSHHPSFDQGPGRLPRACARLCRSTHEWARRHVQRPLAKIDQVPRPIRRAPLTLRYPPALGRPL